MGSATKGVDLGVRLAEELDRLPAVFVEGRPPLDPWAGYVPLYYLSFQWRREVAPPESTNSRDTNLEQFRGLLKQSLQQRLLQKLE